MEPGVASTRKAVATPSPTAASLERTAPALDRAAVDPHNTADDTDPKDGADRAADAITADAITATGTGCDAAGATATTAGAKQATTLATPTHSCARRRPVCAWPMPPSISEHRTGTDGV